MVARAVRVSEDPVTGPSTGSWRREPGLLLLPARLFLGITFGFAGMQKLADPGFFDPSRPHSIQSQLALFRQVSPIGFLLGPAQSHPVAIGVLTALAELAVGLGMLFGLWTRIAASGGFLLSASFFLTVSWQVRPYYYGSDIVFMVLWLPFLVIGAGGVLSLDTTVRRITARQLGGAPGRMLRPHLAAELKRRTLIRSAALAGLLAGVGGILAVVDAALGRFFARSRSPASPVPAGAGRTSSPGAAVAVAKVSDVPVGGALGITLPSGGAPAYVVQPAAGQFKAFSGTCTHAGCTVDFLEGRREFRCPCHGSVFDASSGSVLVGPASVPLPQIPIRVSAGQIDIVGS